MHAKNTFAHDRGPAYRSATLTVIVLFGAVAIVMESKGVSCLVARYVGDVLGNAIKIIREGEDWLVNVS